MTDQLERTIGYENGASPPSEGNTLLLFSVSHHHAPVEIREKLAFDEEQRSALLRELSRETTEAVGITTCNRTELYLVAPRHGEITRRLLDMIARHAGSDPREIQRVSRLERDQEAARHLFRVASGLDSAILGEPQILGQVREALAVAHEESTAGPILERLFQRALATGKRARSSTGISRGAGSISSAAVKLARDTVGDLTGKRALTVGVGEMGCLVARNLRAHGVSALQLCNRTLRRAEVAAEEIGGDVVPWEALESAVREADIVITATGADDYILTPEHLISTNGHRPDDVLIIDISVPRNVDPDVDSIEHVQLFDIDALQAVQTRGMQDRQGEIPRVEAIIHEEVEEFLEWLRGRQLAPVIQGLYRRASSIQERELEKALSRLGHLSERDREVVRAMAHGITQKMLHTPVSRLKTSDEPADTASVLNELFGEDRAY